MQHDAQMINKKTIIDKNQMLEWHLVINGHTPLIY